MIRVGVIGCGGIAPWHISAINETQGMTLTAVCDSNMDFAVKTAKEQGVKAFFSADEMLSSSEIDAAAICTPSGLHADLAVKALENGIYPIVEKPMAITPESLDRLLEAEKNSKSFICPISQLRFLSDVNKVKEALENGRLGKVILSDLSMKYWRDEKYYAEKKWRGTWSMDGGGALMNQGIHGLDLLCWLCGTPDCVSASAGTLCHDIETEDTLSASLRFDNGAVCNVIASTAAFPGFPRRLEICGDKGSVTLIEGELAYSSVPGLNVHEHIGGGHSDPFAIDSMPHKMQYRNIADAILGKAPLLVTSSEAAKTLRLIFDIYRSAGIR